MNDEEMRLGFLRNLRVGGDVRAITKSQLAKFIIVFNAMGAPMIKSGIKVPRYEPWLHMLTSTKLIKPTIAVNSLIVDFL